MAEIKPVFSQAEKKVRHEIADSINQALGKKFSPDFILIDYPPDQTLGDYSVPCFLLAKSLKKKPFDLANELAKSIKPKELIKKVVAQGPYLNFFVDQEKFIHLVLAEIFKAKEKYGQSQVGKNQKIMVEYFSPNTNKPLTIGHVRNICLGSSLVELLRFTGSKVIRSTLYNDRGIAIAKAIVGYQKWGQNQEPKTLGLKPDHFVGSYYVKFCQEAKNDLALEQEAKHVLQAWEEDKKEIRQVWQKLMAWVLAGFWQTLNRLGVTKFDEEYYESEYYREGKAVVENGLKQGVFVKDKEGLVFALLEKFGLPNKIVLRPDDTSLYVTQDLYLAYLKDKYQLDRSIYVVGSEQELYFKQLFKILELLGFKNAKNYSHLSYGMIRLASGKIKSREGLIKGTGADELLAELDELAKTEIKRREKEITDEELTSRAEKISLAALKFYILVVNPKTTMVFDPKKSIAFLGKTGPYLQYVVARINSIFAKVETKVSGRVDFSVLTDELEFNLVKMLSLFPRTVDRAAREFDPSNLANYLYDLARSFSLFYEKLPVIKADDKIKKARLLLIYDTKIVLETGFNLLGIPVLEKM